MQYVAMLWTQNKGRLIQMFGPYPTETAADAAADRLADWPAMKNGLWEVVPLYPDPPQQSAGAPMSTTVQQLIRYYTAPQWTYTYEPHRNPYWVIGTFTGGQTIPATNAEITFKATL